MKPQLNGALKSSEPPKQVVNPTSVVWLTFTYKWKFAIFVWSWPDIDLMSFCCAQVKTTARKSTSSRKKVSVTSSETSDTGSRRSPESEERRSRSRSSSPDVEITTVTAAVTVGFLWRVLNYFQFKHIHVLASTGSKGARAWGHWVQIGSEVPFPTLLVGFETDVLVCHR